MAGQKATDELHNLLSILRRRFLIILACCVFVPAAALSVSLRQEKNYTASSLLLFRDPAFDQQLFGSTVLPQSNDATREAATNVRLVSVNSVAERVARRAAIRSARPTITVDEVAGAIRVRPEGQADVASVIATANDPEFAALLANTFANEFIRYRRETDRKTIRVAQRLIEDQIAALDSAKSSGTGRRASLESRAQELGILGALQTGDAQLVQRAETPNTPSSPKTTRNVAVGLVFGTLLLGIILALILERLDRRFRTSEDVAAAFERPILATIPRFRPGAQHRRLARASNWSRSEFCAPTCGTSAWTKRLNQSWSPRSAR